MGALAATVPLSAGCLSGSVFPMAGSGSGTLVLPAPETSGGVVAGVCQINGVSGVFG